MLIELTKQELKTITETRWASSEERYSKAASNSFKAGSARVGGSQAFRMGLAGEFATRRFLLNWTDDVSPVDTRGLPPWECPPFDLSGTLWGKPFKIDVKTTTLHGLRETTKKVDKLFEVCPDLWFAVCAVASPDNLKEVQVVGFAHIKTLRNGVIANARDGRPFTNYELPPDSLMAPARFLAGFHPF